MTHEDALKLIESINSVHFVLFAIMLQLSALVWVMLFKD